MLTSAMHGHTHSSILLDLKTSSTDSLERTGSKKIICSWIGSHYRSLELLFLCVSSVSRYDHIAFAYCFSLRMKISSALYWTWVLWLLNWQETGCEDEQIHFRSHTLQHWCHTRMCSFAPALLLEHQWLYFTIWLCRSLQMIPPWLDSLPRGSKLTGVMVWGKHHWLPEKPPTAPPLGIQNTIVNRVRAVKFLGTTIQQDLKWDTNTKAQ